MRPTLIALLDRSWLHSLAALVPTSGAVYVAVLFGLGIMLWRRAREAHLATHHAVDLCIVGGLSAVICARAYYLLVSGDMVRLPVRDWFSASGTASWGAYIGVVLGVGGYTAARRLPTLVWFDLLATLQPIGEVVGRWACWLAGDDFGRVTHVPWAIQFPAGSYAWNAHVDSGLIGSDAAWSLPVHPEQFYLMANALAVFLIISAVWRRMRDRPGFTLATYLVLYGASRFDWEFFRDPAAGGAATGLSSSQWMCVVYVVVGCVLLLIRRRQEQGLHA